MSTTQISLSRVLVLIFLAFMSCSKAKQDYEDLQRIQDEADKAIQRTTDYDIKIKSCDNIIGSLQAFLEKYPDGKWSDVAKTALMSWQSKKNDLVRERDNLLSERNNLKNQLFARLKERAIEEAQKVHSMSKIEEIKLFNRDEVTENLKILVRDTYSVRMRGSLLGVHIFKLNVVVSGHVLIDSKEVFVDEKAVVQE